MATASAWSRLPYEAPPLVVRPPGAKRSAPWTGLLLSLGALAAASGAYLPFEKISGPGGSYTVTGLRVETTTGGLSPDAFDAGWGGWVVFGCAALALLQGLRVMAGNGAMLGAIVMIVVTGAGAFVSYLLLHTPDRRAGEVPAGVTDTLGLGVQLALAGCALALVAALLALLVRPRRVV